MLRFDGGQSSIMRIIWYFVAVLSPLLLASPLSLTDTAQSWAGPPALLRPWQGSLVGTDARCFSQGQWPGVHLRQTDRQDCLEAAKMIVRGGKTRAPMHFSREKGAGLALPETWAYGTCAIRVDAKEHEDEDTFPIFVLSNAAFHVAQQCAKPATPGLGGTAYIGPKKVIMVFVYGHVPESLQQPPLAVPPGADIA